MVDKKTNMERACLSALNEMQNAGISVKESVHPTLLRFERYPVFVAFYDSFLADVYPEASEAVLENIKRLKTEGREVVFIDTFRVFKVRSLRVQKP